MLFRTIGFFDGDVQVARTAGWIKIVDGEWTRRNVSFVDGITVLFNGYLRAAFGHPANDRGEPFHTVRQHIVIRRDLYAFK